MSKVNTKDNIWIEGFSEPFWENMGIKPFEYKTYNGNELVYYGKISEIPYELFDDVLDRYKFWDKKQCYCSDRVTCRYCEITLLNDDNEFIEELIPEEWCIIYKINKL